MNRSANKRRRGVVLTSQGLQKFQEAKFQAELQENAGNRYTLEDLSDRTGLSVDTLMKVLRCEAGVDQRTLQTCFRAFDLVLESTDYRLPALSIQPENRPDPPFPTHASEPELPEGQVPLDSEFYVERSPLEQDCYKSIQQPGALIRIKAPRRMGKTSLITRILHQAIQVGYHAVPLNLQLIDKAVFYDLDKFLQWFCVNVGLNLQLPHKLSTYWDALFGSKISCKMYFEEYLLAETTAPVVLALDDIDRLFQYPDLADDFFGLLRTWHEEAKNREIWRKLRLVVAHSTEVYIPLSVNQSPFNVGLPIELPPFSTHQIQNLAARYRLNWSEQDAEQLNALVSGHPHLVRLALYHIWRQDVMLDNLLPTADGIYGRLLQQLLLNLQQDPDLTTAFAQVVMAYGPVEVDWVQAFKLQSMGLVQLQGNYASPSCELYRKYFCDRFKSNS